jgi:hypothetical protein
MHLDTQTDVKQLLGPLLDKPQPLEKMLDKVRIGLTEEKHHPVIGMVICAALDHPVAQKIFNHPNSALIKRTFNHMFLLEQLVTKISEDNAFLERVKEHVGKTLENMTKQSGSSWLPDVVNRFIAMYRAAGWFGVSKDATVKMAIDRISRLREKGSFDKWDVFGSQTLLSVNIAEATTTDWRSSHSPNYQVGKKLVMLQPTTVDVVGKEKAFRYGFSDDWARLYETWNAAFVTGNLHYLNILYPKLFTPSVLLADGPTYMYTRAIALWLSVNFYLIAALQGSPQTKFEGQNDLADIWGAMNLKYSEYLEKNNKFAVAEPKK